MEKGSILGRPLSNTGLVDLCLIVGPSREGGVFTVEGSISRESFAILDSRGPCKDFFNAVTVELELCCHPQSEDINIVRKQGEGFKYCGEVPAPKEVLVFKRSNSDAQLYNPVSMDWIFDKGFTSCKFYAHYFNFIPDLKVATVGPVWT